MPYMKLNDLNLYYEEFGTGEPILFLHSAYSRGILAFSGQIQPFYTKYHCFYPDFRGHGRTICNSLDWDSQKICDDMINFLKALNISKVHLIGYSTGGGIGFYLASQYPEVVKSLTVIGNGGVIDDAGSDEFEPEELLKNNKIDFIDKAKSLHYDAHRGNWKYYCMQEVNDWRKHPNLSDKDWNKIKMPLLLIAGEMDHYATSERLMNIKKVCNQAEIMVVKGSGHRPHMPMENAKEVNQRIFRFLDTTN
ncbi:alpha/beta fold hydrolase [Clostridium oryzae]|uniref:AB hydrolase superfamily protein YvaM n=1 Tax=Clostridium oryzae TaxID=1450648 RepID=A0A1V4I5E1_9CLOT|nr:alpha/beta hydrolase [Clostridium oryzae]OPJ55109.1 AB hydrolase superfamily protein YvaM [Clostridium oryzae]